MESKPASRNTLAIMLTVMLSLSAMGAVAEDGTSGTLPDSTHQCEIVAASWTAPEATPAPAASPVSTPVASPVASPVATQEAELAPLTADLETATHAILDCMSDNNLEILLELTGEDFRGSWLGFGSGINDADFAILLPMLTSLPYELVDIEDVTVDGDIATATVKFTAGRQLRTSEWTYQLVERDGQRIWQVQRENPMPTEAPEGAAWMSLIIDDGSFFIDSTTYPSGDIVIDVVNIGVLPHEALIVRVPTGTDATDFVNAPDGIPPGGTFVAQVTVPAERGGTIVLTDIRPGTYTIVDLLPDENGVPNVSNGMISEFTVE